MRFNRKNVLTIFAKWQESSLQLRGFITKTEMAPVESFFDIGVRFLVCALIISLNLTS